jgi:gliding motility-associated-like protein
MKPETKWYKRVGGIFLFFLLVSTPQVHAQKENYTWICNGDILINFNSPGPPLSLLPASALSFSLGRSTTLSDRTTGSLLLHTDGIKVMDQNYNLMPNGSGLYGGDMVVVPFIGNPDKYYLFTTGLPGTSQFQLNYSVIDMTLNSGNGDVVAGQKNLLVDPVSIASPVIGVSGNDCNFWIITHERHTRNFRSYEVTSAGINPVPVISNLPPVSTLGIFDFSFVNMEVSPDRGKILLMSGYAELLDFSPGTGYLTNPIFILPDSSAANCRFGCFAPDNSKLYLQNDENLYQYDLSVVSEAAIAASRIFITDSIAGAMRIGPDNKIYAPFGAYYLSNGTYAATSNQYLSCMQQPTLSGTAVQYTPYFIPVPPGGQIWNIPKAIPRLFKDTLHSRMDTLLCPSQGVVLSVTGDSTQWEDGSVSPIRNITQEGIYYVTYKEECHWKVDTYAVRRYEGLDSFSLGRDTSFCQSGTLLLSPDLTGIDRFVWDNGSTDSTYIVSESGNYSITVSKDHCSTSDSLVVGVADLHFDLGRYPAQCDGSVLELKPDIKTDGVSFVWQDSSRNDSYPVTGSGTYTLKVRKDGCEAIDAVQIVFEACDCRQMIPTAFSPNGDGLNDIFLPEFSCDLIKGYFLEVYNRWGERVYRNERPSKGWDGTWNGRALDAGTYYYRLQYENLRAEVIQAKGDLVLIR